MAEYYLNYECLISLHKSEGFGLAIAENMAIGNLIISTAAGGTSDLIIPQH